MQHFSAATIVGIVNTVNGDIYNPVLTLPLQIIFDNFNQKPPEGFQATQLGEIADLRNGLVRSSERYAKNSTSLEENNFFLLTSRALQEDGSISISELQTIDQLNEDTFIVDLELNNKFFLRPNDIIISSYFSSKMTVKVAFISDDIPEKVLYTNGLIRIRVTDKSIKPYDVFTFLHSGAGQIALQNHLNQSRIALQDLSKVTIFIPLASTSYEKATEELGTAARVIRQLSDKIIPVLKDIERQEGNSPSIEHVLEPIGQQLIEIATPIAPIPIIDRVILEYPTPIALAARRFQESRFDIYEQVLRLRDLFEAASFFVYHIILANALHNLPMPVYYVSSKPVRKAYEDFSMKYRLDFIEAILTIAQNNNGREIFIPELLYTSIVSTAKKLQADFRNVLSHTATPSIRQQRSVIENFKPEVEKILEELQFLSQYRLVRIPTFRFSNKLRMARLEVYKGVAPFIEEESIKIDVDSNHLGILNQDGEFLDLYPLYQLVDVSYQIEQTQEKRYETHLSFLKYIRANQLHGESVLGGFELPLEGHDEFHDLQLKLHSST